MSPAFICSIPIPGGGPPRNRVMVEDRVAKLIRLYGACTHAGVNAFEFPLVRRLAELKAYFSRKDAPGINFDI